MYRMRQWSVRGARGLNALYRLWEAIPTRLHPLFAWIGYERLDGLFSYLAIEKPIKSFLFDSRSCGNYTLRYTGMSCRVLEGRTPWVPGRYDPAADNRLSAAKA